jgi:hypothetical protein
MCCTLRKSRRVLVRSVLPIFVFYAKRRFFTNIRRILHNKELFRGDSLNIFSELPCQHNAKLRDLSHTERSPERYNLGTGSKVSFSLLCCTVHGGSCSPKSRRILGIVCAGGDMPTTITPGQEKATSYSPRWSGVDIVRLLLLQQVSVTNKG